jgi:maltooligosyltrehalose trehalohydrolase
MRRRSPDEMSESMSPAEFVRVSQPKMRPGVFPDAAGTQFNVWAPDARHVELQIEQARGPRRLTLERASGGYHTITTLAPPGTRYAYVIDGDGPWPDPCSRFQPDGPHGPSEVVDTGRFAWTDAAWRGVSMAGQVFYELHIGAFTSAGTYEAARGELPRLKTLGITTIELMPVAEFPGRFNWGYDGVQLFAPFHGYGKPAGLAGFVDAAHALGLGVILDVVYNHLGPDGNYLSKYAAHYFTSRYANEWGEALNFDGAHSHGVRDFFIENARFWISEYHLDGLRLDATQSIHDAGPSHVLGEISAAARAAAGERSIVLVAENEPQQVHGLRPVSRGGYGLDGLWNDDFHHSARVAVTGRSDGYLRDYRGRPQEFISSAQRGFLYQGQWYSWQKKRRGTRVTDEPASAFVAFIQNHDQVANTFDGRRMHSLTSRARERALTALLLLGPQTPLLFMGQEYSATTPFPFFADHTSPLSRLVHEGRRDFLAQFPAYGSPDARERIPDPADPATFEAAKLREDDRAAGAPMELMHRELIALRRADPVISRQDRFSIDGAVLGEQALALRFGGGGGETDRLLLVNLGAASEEAVLPEPLLVPGEQSQWVALWDSDDPRYGGCGTPQAWNGDRWHLPAEHASLWMSARRRENDR